MRKSQALKIDTTSATKLLPRQPTLVATAISYRTTAQDTMALMDRACTRIEWGWVCVDATGNPAAPLALFVLFYWCWLIAGEDAFGYFRRPWLPGGEACVEFFV